MTCAYIHVACILLVHVSSTASAGPNGPYVGVHSDRLFDALGLSGAASTSFRATPIGAAYDGVVGFRNARLTGLSLGVCLTTNDAKRIETEIAKKLPTSPLANAEPLGSESNFWSASGGQSGTFYVRVENVVFGSAWIGPMASVVEFAKAVSNAIQNDPSIAPRGSFEPLPEIVSSGFPERAYNGRCISLVPTITGLGAADVVRYAVEVVDFTPAVAQSTGIPQLHDKTLGGHGPAGKAELELAIPANGRGRIRLTAINPVNVTVSKEQEVEFETSSDRDAPAGEGKK